MILSSALLYAVHRRSLTGAAGGAARTAAG